MNTATAQKPRKDEITTTSNFGDFQNGVYAEALQGVNSRYPFDFASIERKASETLPEWVYRYVSAARRGRADPTRQCGGVFPLRHRAPDDGQSAKA